VRLERHLLEQALGDVVVARSRDALGVGELVHVVPARSAAMRAAAA